MVDKTTTETNTENEASAVLATQRRTRRRAASRPAGPPVAEATDTASSAADSGAGDQSPPVKKAAAKKSTAKKSAAKEPAAKKTAAKKAPAKKAASKKTASAGAEEASTSTSSVEVTPAAPVAASAIAAPIFQAPEPVVAVSTPRRRTRSSVATSPATEENIEPNPAAADEPAADGDDNPETSAEEGESGAPRRRRRRGGRGRRSSAATETTDDTETDEGDSVGDAGDESDDPDDDSAEGTSSRRRRRRRRRGQDATGEPDDPANTVVKVRETRGRSQDTAGLRGSTRLEAKRQRRRDGRDAGRRRAPILTESEFLARREAVSRIMAVRESDGRVQIAVLEDGVLVEHYVDQGSSGSMVGNVYLGRVQNVLPSMEAAFVDIGRGRNAVLYAGEVNWDAAGLEGQPKRIELALKSGDPIVVQVTKDPVGQKGARLTSQVSLAGRYLVFVPDGSMTGISRKLPDTERSRLKAILKRVVPEGAGVIIRTAAEGASEEEISRDIARLQAQWDEIQSAKETATPPSLIHAEPDLAIKVIRDIFNEDFTSMVITGSQLRSQVDEYVSAVAPDLAERIETWAGPKDLFTEYRIDEQLTKALDRKVWLPSGGSLVIDRTEAMTVVDVNTGKFTGQGGNLEETVTKNNIEAAEEIVRQLRLRDIGGIIVVDFIDMVLESNRDLVLRRLVECLGRDRTKHQVAEVTSLGLVQMTRKRIGQGLLEAYSVTCDACGGRGMHVSLHGDQGGAEKSEKSEKPQRAAKPAKPATAGRRKGKGVDPADVVPH
jgi:ribonuclease E